MRQNKRPPKSRRQRKVWRNYQRTIQRLRVWYRSKGIYTGRIA